MRVFRINNKMLKTLRSHECIKIWLKKKNTIFQMIRRAFGSIVTVKNFL